MKIVFFTDVYLEVAGGITTSIRGQKTELERLGHEVIIFCPGHKKTPTEPNVYKVPTMKHANFGDAPTSKRPKVVKKWILENHPEIKEADVFHVHYEASCSIAGAQLARELNIPLVQTIHGREDMAIDMNIPTAIKYPIARILDTAHSICLPHATKIKKDNYLAPNHSRARMWELMVNHANFADAVITPSQHFADKLKHYGVTKPQFIVSNGIPDATVKKIAKSRTWDGESPLQIIWNSRVSREKRILPFLEALDPEMNFHLDIYGDGNDLTNAKKCAIIKGIDSKITFYGFTPHETILKNLKKYHLSVMASYGFDNQSMILLEAVAAGLPVLYCDPDMSEVVPKGGAMLTKTEQPPAIRDALSDILSHPTKIAKMSKIMYQNRQAVAESTQVKELLKVYQSVIK